jgi:hypothetical protein
MLKVAVNDDNGQIFPRSLGITSLPYRYWEIARLNKVIAIF